MFVDIMQSYMESRESCPMVALAVPPNREATLGYDEWWAS